MFKHTMFSSPSPRPSPARGEGVLVALPESKVISKTSPDFYPQVPVLQADEVQFPLSPALSRKGRGSSCCSAGVEGYLKNFSRLLFSRSGAARRRGSIPPSPRPSPARGEGVLVALPES